MPSPYPHIGSLNQQITIQSLVTAKSASSGAITKTWTTFWTGNAAINFGSGSETEKSDTTIVVQNMAFTIRYKAGIIETMRIVFDGQNYNIQSIQLIGRKRYIKLIAKLIKK